MNNPSIIENNRINLLIYATITIELLMDEPIKIKLNKINTIKTKILFNPKDVCLFLFPHLHIFY